MNPNKLGHPKQIVFCLFLLVFVFGVVGCSGSIQQMVPQEQELTPLQQATLQAENWLDRFGYNVEKFGLFWTLSEEEQKKAREAEKDALVVSYLTGNPVNFNPLVTLQWAYYKDYGVWPPQNFGGLEPGQVVIWPDPQTGHATPVPIQPGQDPSVLPPPGTDPSVSPAHTKPKMGAVPVDQSASLSLPAHGTASNSTPPNIQISLGTAILNELPDYIANNDVVVAVVLEKLYPPEQLQVLSALQRPEVTQAAIEIVAPPDQVAFVQNYLTEHAMIQAQIAPHHFGDVDANVRSAVKRILKSTGVVVE